MGVRFNFGHLTPVLETVCRREAKQDRQTTLRVFPVLMASTVIPDPGKPAVPRVRPSPFMDGSAGKRIKARTEKSCPVVHCPILGGAANADKKGVQTTGLLRNRSRKQAVCVVLIGDQRAGIFRLVEIDALVRTRRVVDPLRTEHAPGVVERGADARVL